jgi:hypothetical protein
MKTPSSRPSQAGDRGPVQINVEISPDLEAVYSNFVVLTHSPSEIVIDFARILPRTPKASVHARIIMTPMNAKLLHKALGENLAKFEDRYGEIKLSQPTFEDPRPIGFVTPKD